MQNYHFFANLWKILRDVTLKQASPAISGVACWWLRPQTPETRKQNLRIYILYMNYLKSLE